MINPKQIFSKENKALFFELVRTDFKLRYQGSALGYVWSLLKPLMLFGILFIVFTKFLNLGKGVPNYPTSLLLGIILWTFFVEATSNSLKSIVSRGSLIRKIKIPIYLIPISTAMSALINLLLNLVVVFIFILLFSTSPHALSWDTLIIFPLLIVELILLSVGFGIFLSATYVRFRDIDHVWDVIKQALFYTIPIIYPLSKIPNIRVQELISLNPLTQIIQEARKVTTYSGTQTIFDLFPSKFVILIPIGLVIAMLSFSIFYFKKRVSGFGEIV